GRKRPQALLACAAGHRGGRPVAGPPQGARAGTVAERRLRLLRPAAGRAGLRLRRAVADRVDGLRRRGRPPPRPGRQRAHRRLRPHRHAEAAGARARAAGPGRAAGRLAAVNTLASRRPLYLVDASLYVFRAWHSMPDEFQDAQGWPTNAVHGFARFLLELLERERPAHIAIAFDEALDSCFRHQLYPAYKANREPAPEALRRQFAHCKALCAALGLGVLADRDYEADDLIGSALHASRGDASRGVIVSADK